MKKNFISLLILLVTTNSSFASDSEKQAESFANIYSSTCLKNLTNLDKLRNKLKKMPKLPPEKSVGFLSGDSGEAWPVPDKYGLFVLAIPNDKDICMVYARRANTVKAEELFTTLVAKAPVPLVSKLIKDENLKTKTNGENHTISYEWAIPNTSKRMLFTITTSNFDKAQLQVLGSAAIVTIEK